MKTARAPFRLLFLCTGNSARSQIAEAILNRKAAGRFEAHSAGSEPAARVNDPAAVGGVEVEQRAAFDDALRLISCRIDLMLALPLEKLECLALRSRLQAIGERGVPADVSAGAAP